MIQQIFKCSPELHIEFFDMSILVNVKIQEMAEDVVVIFELEAVVVFVQRLEHFLRIHCWWW